MSPFRYQDEESPATGALYIALGALAGFAAGIVVAQHYGGISGLTDTIRERIGRSQARGGDTDEHETFDESDGEYDDHERPLDPTEELEERSLLEEKYKEEEQSEKETGRRQTATESLHSERNAVSCPVHSL